MLFHDLVQGSPEWFTARLGVATASCFDKIVQPSSGKLSKSAPKYALSLIGERITGAPSEKFESFWMERGALLEEQARNAYEIITDYTLATGGFATNDAMTIGASPDARVLDASGKVVGGAEIKCPKIDTHLMNALRDDGEVDPSYKAQVQGQILVCGFQFVDFVSFYPDQPPVIHRVMRDDAYCEALSEALDGFVSEMDAVEARLVSMGYTIPKRPIQTIQTSKPKTDYMRAG